MNNLSPRDKARMTSSMPVEDRPLCLWYSEDGIARIEDVKLNKIVVGVLTGLMGHKVPNLPQLVHTCIAIDAELQGLWLQGNIKERLAQAQDHAKELQAMCSGARALARRSAFSRDECIQEHAALRRSGLGASGNPEPNPHSFVCPFCR